MTWKRNAETKTAKEQKEKRTLLCFTLILASGRYLKFGRLFFFCEGKALFCLCLGIFFFKQTNNALFVTRRSLQVKAKFSLKVSKEREIETLKRLNKSRFKFSRAFLSSLSLFSRCFFCCLAAKGKSSGQKCNYSVCAVFKFEFVCRNKTLPLRQKQSQSLNFKA